MSHLLVCGAAGYTNIGDDAILWGMLTQLRAAFASRPIKVAGGPELGPLVQPFGAAPLSYDDRAELARAVEEADLVILGGGGLLYDVGYDAGLHRLLGDPADRQWLYEMARIAAAAAAAGRPAMLYGIGAGPLMTDAARQAAKFICAQTHAISLRDDASAELLAECGVARSRLYVAADPAIMVEPSDSSRLLDRLGIPDLPRPLVGINLRPWGDEDNRRRLIGEAAEAIRELRGQLGGGALLLPFQRLYDDDLLLLARVSEDAGGAAVLVREHLSPPDVAAALAQCDLVIGMRLHALVLALAAGKPFVAVSYDPKVDEFARAVGLEAHAHAAATLKAEALIRSCRELLQREDLAIQFRARRDEMRKLAGLSVELATDVVSAGRAARPSAVVTPDARPAGQIRVLTRIRPDYLERPGGDTVQMEQTKRYLERLGVKVQVSGEESPDLSGCDIVHTFNLGRPEEPYRHCLQAVQQDKPVVLSTVYWDFSEFWQCGDPDYWELPAPGEGPPIPRPAPPPDPVEARRRARLDQQRRAAIDCADVYLPNGQGEADLLHDSYGMDLARTVIVPNAVDDVFFSARPDLFVERYGLRDFVLCAARVEKRKNQLALVAALRGTGLQLVIAGQPNPEEYRELCRTYADENVVFLDLLSQQELASAYAAAKVHALPGWFETPGLSTLEAAAAGCNIVSTDRGTAKEYLGDKAWYCDPRSIESVRDAVLAAHAAPRSQALRELVRERYTWQQAAETTLHGYRLALALHQQRDPRARCETALRALREHADFLAKLAADRGYEAEQMRRWGETVEAELIRLQHEFDRVTSGRLHRWSAALARAGWGVLRKLGVRP